MDGAGIGRPPPPHLSCGVRIDRMSGNRPAVLVTGGAGFIGSRVTTALVDAGHEVRVLDCLLPVAWRGAEPAVDPRAEIVVADVTDPQVARASLDGVDVVCHHAAMVGMGMDIRDQPEFVRNNDLGTSVLLAAMAERGVERLVLASSMVVYGEGGYRCATHGRVRPAPRRVTDLALGRFESRCPRCSEDLRWTRVTEDAPFEPRSTYAATKVAQEHLAAAWQRETGGRVVALRYHNVYGPLMPRDTPYAGVAAIFRSAVESGRAPAVFEDGGQTRDFVHVDDVAAANVCAVAVDPDGFAALNIASGHPVTVLDLATTLSRVLGGPPPRVTGDYRAGDVRHVVAAPGAAAAVIGFRARIHPTDGLSAFATAELRAAVS
jgi:dTDP-L-rhamnose 4-epimerase